MCIVSLRKIAECLLEISVRIILDQMTPSTALPKTWVRKDRKDPDFEKCFFS